MKNLTLKDYGVFDLNAKEMSELNGGVDWAKFLKGSGWAYLGVQVVTHWSEIKTGFKAGYNSTI